MNPLFVDEPDPASAPTTDGDLHLGAGSACIDAGDNTAVAGLTTDFEGDPRIIDGDGDGTATVDIDADEFLAVGFDPWGYDADRDGVISKLEALAAIVDYFDGKITKLQTLQVVVLYFG